jgi:hypothetical protein
MQDAYVCVTYMQKGYKFLNLEKKIVVNVISVDFSWLNPKNYSSFTSFYRIN